MDSGRQYCTSPCASHLKPSRKPMTSKPWLMPSMVAAAMTPLRPGAGPPPTNMPNLPLLMEWMVDGKTAIATECGSAGKIQFHSCQKPTPDWPGKFQDSSFQFQVTLA